MVFLTEHIAMLVSSLCPFVLGKCHRLLQEDENQAQKLESSHCKVILSLGSPRPKSFR